MVLPDSNGISRVPPYSGTPHAVFDFAYEAVTRYGRTFQTVLLSTYGSIIGALQPHTAVAAWFRLFPLSLAVTNGISVDFFSCPYLDAYRDWETDRKSTRLNSSHSAKSRMPSSA